MRYEDKYRIDQEISYLLKTRDFFFFFFTNELIPTELKFLFSSLIVGLLTFVHVCLYVGTVKIDNVIVLIDTSELSKKKMSYASKC